jgi:hypothetical protein
MDTIKQKISDAISKKLSVVLIGILTVVLNQKLHLGISPVEIAGMAASISAYVMAQAHVDAKRIEAGLKK